MITVRIEEETLIEMLVDRVGQWRDDEDTIELYRKMYESYVYGGCFDGSEFDVMAIVDNDIVNDCEVLCEGDEDYDAVKAVYDNQGLGDCSCEDCGYSYIEAEYNGKFLVRW